MCKKKLKIYLACGLTHVPRKAFADYVEFLNNLATHLPIALPVSIKYALRDSDPRLSSKPFGDRARLCYIWDREMVEEADLVIGEASYPSTGLGIELQVACSADTPIILLFRKAKELQAPPVDYSTPDAERHNLQVGEGYISLMALGLPSVFRVVPYTHYTDAMIGVKDAMSAVLRSSPGGET